MTNEPDGFPSLLAALKEMSKKYDGDFYAYVKYWEVERWIKLAQRGATFSINSDGISQRLVWDKKEEEQER